LILYRPLLITKSWRPSKSLQSLVSDPNEDFPIQYQFSFTPFVLHMCLILTPLLDYCAPPTKKKKSIYETQPHGRSHWPRGLNSGSEAASLLGLWVGIPWGARKSVSCKCCVLSGRGFCHGSISPEESYRVLCI
jgi:hypothetical protein